MIKGKEMHKWLTELFPINRSITGNGVRETLSYFQKLLPNLQIHSIPSGTKVYDWIIPEEWVIKNAYIMHENGEKILDLKDNNLHL